MPFIVPDEAPTLGVGNHNIEVADARAGLSKAGNDMLIFDLIPVGRLADYPDDAPTHVAFVTITARSAWKVREVFEAFGLEMPAGGEQFDERDFIGRRANVDIVDHSDGFPPKVDTWAPYVGSDIPSDNGPTQAEPTQAERAAAKYGDDLPWEAKDEETS